MLKIIAYVVLALFLALVAVYFWVEAQRKKEKELKQQAIAFKMSTMKDQFKQDLNQMVENQLLSKAGSDSIYRIANNFFVFQAVSDDSIFYCEQILRQVSDALPELNREKSNLELAQEVTSLFVESLPTEASGYNAHFYRMRLPELITLLITHQEQADDAKLQSPSETESEFKSEPKPQVESATEHVA